MTGKMIHLVFRQNLVTREMVLMTPHATWKGAVGDLERIADYYKEKGYSVSCQDGGTVRVTGKDGKGDSLFFISSRTIEE